MMNRLYSTAPAPSAGAAALDDVYDLFADDLPTEEVPVLPSYVTEVPRDVLREEYVELNEEELAKHLRPEEEIRGRTLSDDLTDAVGNAVDQVLLAPMRLLFANLGFIVAGIAVLAGVAYSTSYLIDAVMGNFNGSMF